MALLDAIIGQADRGTFEQGLKTGWGIQDRSRQEKARGLAGAYMSGQLQGPAAELAQVDPQLAGQLMQYMGVPMGTDREERFRNDVMVAAGLDPQGAMQYLQQRISENEAMGIPSPRMREGLVELQQDPVGAMQGIRQMADAFKMTAMAGKPSPTQQKGMSFRMTTPDGPAIGTTSYDPVTGGTKLEVTPLGEGAGFVSELGETPKQKTEREIKETGGKEGVKSAVEAGQKAFEQASNVSQGIALYDEAISAIDQGANTGKISSYMPSFKEASVRLDNIRNRLGLNVISMVTFGALSEAEMKMALDTGLPTGLDEPELRQWLVAKKQSQQKLLAELTRAAEFLTRGNNTIADYIQLRQAQNVAPGNDKATSGQKIGRFTVEVE